MSRLLRLGGHLGDRVSALVDGQLSADEEERAWSHTMTCPACRRLVEREGWLKSRLAGMSAPLVGTPEPRPGLIGALYDVDAWSVVDEIERDDHRRRTAFTAVGVGSVGAAVLSIVALTGAPAGNGERVPVRPAPAQIGSQVGMVTGSGGATGGSGVLQSVVSMTVATGANAGSGPGSSPSTLRHRAR